MKKQNIVIALIGLALISLIAFVGCHDTSDDTSVTAPQTLTIRYAAIGASDAVGVCADPMTQNGYVYRIRDGLSTMADRVEFENLGISGAQIDFFETVELPAAIEFKPTLVTIWAGGNDFMNQTPAVNFEASLANILSQLRAQTSAHIVIANLPDMTKLPLVQEMGWNNAEMQTLLAEYNAAILRQALQYDAQVVDLYATDFVGNPANICQDGFHPSNDGYARIAELFLTVIDTIF